MTGGSLRDEQADRLLMRCLPWPLAFLCWLDNCHGPHDNIAGPACRPHDLAYRAYWRLMPRSAGRLHERTVRAAR